MICYINITVSFLRPKKKKGSTGFISQQAGRACAMRKQAPRADNSDKDDALKLQVCFSTIDSTPGRILRLRCSILEKKLRKSQKKPQKVLHSNSSSKIQLGSIDLRPQVLSITAKDLKPSCATDCRDPYSRVSDSAGLG